MTLMKLLLSLSMLGQLTTTTTTHTPTQSVVLSYPTGGYPPYTTADGKGLIVDKVRTLAKKLGYQLEIVQLPAARTDSFSQFQIDCRTKSKALVTNPEQYLWSEHLVTMNDIMVTSANSRYSATNVHEFAEKGGLLGLVNGFSYPQLESILPSIDFTRAGDVQSVVAMLLRQRVDGIIIDERVFLHQLNLRDLSPLDFTLSPPLASYSFRLQCAKTAAAEAFIKALNAQLP